MVARWYVYFQTKYSNLWIFWRSLKWTILIYFMTIWYLCLFWLVFCGHFDILFPFWYVEQKINYLEFMDTYGLYLFYLKKL
jgi:hypothetical protein